MARSKKPYIRYAQDVVEGRQVAGEYIKKACQRFLDDMKRRDIQLRYKTIDRCIAFISLLRHTTGKFSGKPFILQPWQQWMFIWRIILWWLMGIMFPWCSPATGLMTALLYRRGNDGSI